MSILDSLLDPEGAVALVFRERLRPVAGNASAIFPPTFADVGYNIDELRSGKRAILDTVGSQANRMEARFLDPPYSALVPQISISAGDKRVNLLQAPHRLADASVRFSSMAAEVDDAFHTYLTNGDVSPIARLAPMSLVFGVWDSRGTKVNIPRVVGFTIHADDVEILTRSAQLVPAIDHADIDGSEAGDKAKVKDAGWAEIGLAHVPSVATHGGVLCHGEIIREGVVNLTTLRGLRGAEGDGGWPTDRMQRYLLGLALVCTTLPGPYNLRQGCLLVRDGRDAAQVVAVDGDGGEETVTLDHAAALELAQEAAASLGVDPTPREVAFDTAAATEAATAKGGGRKKR